MQAESSHFLEVNVLHSTHNLLIRLLLVCSLVLLLPMTALAATGTAVVRWDNTDTINSVRLEQAQTVAGPFQLLTVLPPDATSYSVSGLTVPSTVCFRAAYVNPIGIGPYSNVACKDLVAGSSPPTTPSNVTVTITITVP
jgi:hypothetical protein